jgi:hypothetical protein
MSGHLSVGEELVAGQGRGPIAAKQKRRRTTRAQLGGDKGQVCSSHHFQKALIAASTTQMHSVLYLVSYIKLEPYVNG